MYHNLGLVAQQQSRFADAEAAYKQALEIFIAVRDEHNMATVQRSLAGLWQLTQSASIPVIVAEASDINLVEAETLLKGLSLKS
jgi:hypothetical protein